jgi:hypothetical protein
MAESSKLIRAVFGSVAILGSAVLGISVMSDTFAASKYKTNFNKQQCKVVASNGSTQGLAVIGSTKNACTCISKSGRRILLPPTPAGVRELCAPLTPQQVRTFSQPSPPDAGPGPGPGPGEPLRGNNGFGNVGEGINPGSDNGNTAQASTKSGDSDGSGVR